MACKYKINGLELTKDEFLNYVKKQPLEESSKILGISTTPSAPFITDTNAYVKLGMRFALKEAVKQGATKIAWTTGEQQNERYDLSKQVQSISYEKKSKEFSSKAQEKGQDLYSLYIETKESGYEQFDDLTISEVEGYVGKDIANKIQNNEGNKENLDTSKGNKKVNKLTGIDLKVGGKGMKDFYGSPYQFKSTIKVNKDRINFTLNEAVAEVYFEGGVISEELPTWAKNEIYLANIENKGVKGDGKIVIEELKEKAKQLGADILTLRADMGVGFGGINSKLYKYYKDLGFQDINPLNPDGRMYFDLRKYESKGSLGIVGNVAKSLFKQEPKVTNIGAGEKLEIRPSKKGDGFLVYTESGEGMSGIFNTKAEAQDFIDRNKKGGNVNEFSQHSIDITPELKAETQQGLPMFQKIEDLPRFNQRQITDEFIDEDWDTWTSAITLISAKDSYVNALAIIDEIIAKRKYQNDDDELNDLLDDIIDFDNSDFRNHHTAVLYNNALQNNYIRFALTARAQSLYEKSTNDETKKLAKYIIGMSRLEMGDIARDAALSLTSFNSNIVPTDKGIMSLFLPANMNTDKVNKKNSYKESGEQRTDIEEAKFVRDETKKRILEHLEESGNIDDVINRLLDKIESGQISQPIGFTSPKNTNDVDKKTWAKNKSDKYVSKGLDLIKNGLSHFKKLGVVPDPQGDAEAIFDIFKGSVYIALGKLLKAKQIFSEIASELGISPEKEWDKYAESELGKAHIAEVKRTAAIDKLKKISPKKGVKETRDHFDEFFDRLRASRNKNSKRIIKNIQQKISELGENTKLNEEEVKLIEDAIIILESENYDTEAAGYEARVGKIDELQEMLDALSSKESTNPLSQETRRRRKVREIVKDSLGGKRALLKEIIADFIKYGSARSTLSELLADVLPIDQAKELEKEVFEELDKMLEESSEAISKEEKKNREATIKDLSNKLSSLQENNREIEMIRGELSKLENSEDSSSKSRQMAELSDRLERLTGEKIDKNKTKQELLSDAKKELNELSSRDNLTDEEKLHKKHLLSHIKLLESNAELDAVIADLNRSIKETSKSQKKEQGTKRTAAIDKLKKISPKKGVKKTRDHFDEFFDRLRASRNKNSKRIIKNIQQKISELGENTKLNEEEVKLIEDAIIILERENYDTEAAGYEARVGKIDELQEMLDALSSKESTNPLSQEIRRRRKVREIVKDSLGGKRALLKEIIADFIKYGSARSTLSELLADVLPIDQAKELEKEVFEELDKMLEESSEAISKEEKKNREATIKDLLNKLSSLQENNREIEMIRGELSKLENSEDSSSKSRQMAELSDRLERLTGEKIDKNKTKQELLSDAKKELNELSSRDNLTDEEKLHKKHLLSHIKLLESNAELDAVIADLIRLIKDTSKSQKKEQGTKKTVSNLIDKLNKIKEGTYKQKTKKEVKVTEEIKALRKQIRELSGARSKLKSFTDRWSPEALLKAIKMGAHDLTDFFAILEDSTDFNFTPKQKKLLYHIHTLVRSSITGQNGHVQNLAATNKAIAMLRNLKSQTNKDVLKRFLYSMASEWAYDSMLSHPSSTINSLLGSVSGYSRIIVEAITRLLKPSDRKAAFKIIKSVWGDFLDSASKAIGLFFSQRSEMALNDLENGFMASGVIDRIWRDKFKDIAKSDNGIVKKVAKIIIKLAVAPVKLMMNIFSATDVFSRNMFRSWNEKWDVYDKVVSKRTESGLDILNAINEELGLKQEVYDQANKEADDLGYTLIRKREYVAKRVLELREQFINDYILVAHADHAARKVMLINNPETSVGASFYSRMNKLNKNENDASYVSLFLMAIKNQIIPFSRNLVNFSHKHLVNTTIPISMVAAGMGKKAEIITRQSLVANLLTQQYDNYRKTIESKQEYDEMYYRYKSMDENSPEAKLLKRKLDEFIIGGVPVFRNGKIEKEIYTKRDLLLDALESAIGYSTALMIFMSYDDDETEQGIVAKKPNWLRVTGSAHGLTYAEKDAANYTPFSIQVKSDDGWNTVLKWPYVFAHPVFFYLGSMTDKNYDKNTNYGLQESSVAEILYHLASSPLSQGSQQGLQTIADATLFVSKEDSSEETLEKLWKSLVTNTARQSVTPGAYVFMSELNRWFTNQTVMTSDDPFKNQLSKMPFLDGLADKTKLSPFGYPYTQPIPIKLAEYFFEDNGQENELTNINKYLVENSVNGVLKYYNSGSNISDDLQGDILIKGFPEEKQFELRDAVASAYGRIVAESNIYNDTKDYKKDYVTSKKALQQTFQKYYEEAIKEGKDLVLREYVMGIATEELEKETYPEKNGKQLLKFVKSKEDITTAMKEWGIRIDDGKIKYIDKMMSPVEIY